MTTLQAAEYDIPRIMEIADATITPGWTYEYVKSRLGRDDTLLIVAVEDGHTYNGNTVLGFAAFRQVGDSGEVLQIAVDPLNQRCGVGGILLGAVVEYAEKKHLAPIFLEVRASNKAAVGLYEKYGFERVRVRKGYYDNPVEDAVIMVRG